MSDRTHWRVPEIDGLSLCGRRFITLTSEQAKVNCWVCMRIARKQGLWR